MAWSLCSKQDVISIHPIAEASLKDFWSDAVEALIREYLGAPNLGKQVEVTEIHDGGVKAIGLDKPPVIAVSELRVNGLAMSPDAYYLDGNALVCRDIIFPPGTGNLMVTYLSGSVTPDDVDPIIRLTAATMIVALVNYRGRAGADASLRFGEATQKEGERTPNYTIGLTSHLTAIMKRMLRRQKIMVQ